MSNSRRESRLAGRAPSTGRCLTQSAEGQTALANQSQICIVNAMTTCPLNAGEYPSARKSWRNDAARIVEDLFRCTPADTWNMLLDLREHLLDGDDWNETLDLFLSCRERLESEQYLPFYRLRRLLCESLRLEAGRNQAHVASLREVLRRKHRSLADIKRDCHPRDFRARFARRGG